MKPASKLALALTLTVLGAAGAAAEVPPAPPAPCTPAWYRTVETALGTGDAAGHGPDVGSDEWQSTVEFRLGLRGRPDLPARDTTAWCERVEATLHGTATAQPTFPCDQATGSVEAMICRDAGLAALDRQLAGVYAAALRKAANERPPLLKAEQRGWIKGRNDCWKNNEPRACVDSEYRRRTAELQARYRLVGDRGPVRLVCDQGAAQEVLVTYFETDPPTLLAEVGDAVSLMYLERSASGARYVGRNESLWEHAGESLLTWGYGAPSQHCRDAR